MLSSLIGCATTPAPVSNTPAVPSPSAMTWDQREKVLSQVHSWDIDAKIAIRNQKGADSANMQWKQANQQYSILLFGPLGSNQVRLTGKPGSVQLEMADGKKVNASSPEILLNQQTGYRLPVSNLYYWIRGMPVPNVAAQKRFDNENRLLELSQSGWLIQFSGYSAKGKIDMPDKIFLSNQAMTVKIIIHQWQI